MIPFIGPDFSDYPLEGRSSIEKPPGILALARGHHYDYCKTNPFLTSGNGEISDQHISSAIRYLDPERTCQNGGGGSILVPVTAVLLTWTVVLVTLLSLAI